MSKMPSTQQKQARPGALAPQGAGDNETASAVSPCSLWAHEAAKVARRSQMLEEALREMAISGTDVSRFLQSKGHHEMAGMIESGSQGALVSE
jgi:hypothetical protein